MRHESNRIVGGSSRQQTPKSCQSRNHGLRASSSSCLRFAAAMSVALSGRVSGTAKMRSSRSISAMVCSASMRINHLARSEDGSNGSNPGSRGVGFGHQSPGKNGTDTPANTYVNTLHSPSHRFASSRVLNKTIFSSLRISWYIRASAYIGGVEVMIARLESCENGSLSSANRAADA
jgi:hypothetical protein